MYVSGSSLLSCTSTMLTKQAFFYWQTIVVLTCSFFRFDPSSNRSPAMTGALHLEFVPVTIIHKSTIVENILRPTYYI